MVERGLKAPPDFQEDARSVAAPGWSHDLPGRRGGWPALQCLALVARQHGVHLTPEQLIHDNQLQAVSVTPAVLLRCANAAGLTGKLLKLKWRHLPKLQNALPAIVFSVG